MKIVWLFVISLISTWNGFLLVLNPIWRRIANNNPTKPIQGIPYRIFVGVVIVQGIVTGTVWALVDVGPSIVVISTLGLILGLLAFDINAAALPEYKFVGRTGVVPALVLCFISSTVSFGLFAAWYLCVIPLVIWAPIGWLVGYFSAIFRFRRFRRQGKRQMKAPEASNPTPTVAESPNPSVVETPATTVTESPILNWFSVLQRSESRLGL